MKDHFSIYIPEPDEMLELWMKPATRDEKRNYEQGNDTNEQKTDRNN
jgi:hypothetical protein